jgi:transposase
LSEDLELLLANCLAPGRRQFVEITANFPEQCRYVLEALGGVYRNDAVAPEQKRSPEQRLHFHQEHSRPNMDKLHARMEAQLEKRKTEPNSGLGKAIQYMLRHWKALTLFLRSSGAPLRGCRGITPCCLRTALLLGNVDANMYYRLPPYDSSR